MRSVMITTLFVWLIVILCANILLPVVLAHHRVKMATKATCVAARVMLQNGCPFQGKSRRQ